MDEFPAWEIYCKWWVLENPSLLRLFAIKPIDIFIRGCYIKHPDFLSHDICFWLGLKLAISSQALARQAAYMKTELRIYQRTLPLELQHSLNQVNSWGESDTRTLKPGGTRTLKPRPGMAVFKNVMNNIWISKYLKKYLTIRIIENLNNSSCGRIVCSCVDTNLWEGRYQWAGTPNGFCDYRLEWLWGFNWSRRVTW